MAGLPGAGKSELAKNFENEAKVKSVHFVRIDMDELASYIEGYTPETADVFRQPATKLLNELFGYVLKRKLNFIMDGTFGSKNALPNIERAIKHGYFVKVIYACQDPKAAWNFTVAREKVEHRAIQFDGFITTYYNILNNLKQIASLPRDRVVLDVAIKDECNGVGQWYRSFNVETLDKIIKPEYNKGKLIEYIQKD